MKNTTPKIINVEIINNEIILTFTPPLEQNEALGVYENAPSATEGNGIGLSFGPSNKLQIPFSQLSSRPVIDYYMIHFSPGGVVDSKIENEDFHDALKFKVTLYDIEEPSSSSSIVSGHSTARTLITMQSYDFLKRPSETVSKTITKNNNTFSLKVDMKLKPYTPYNIKAHGTHHSPEKIIIIGKAPEDNELIANGSFQRGLDDWLQNPYIAEETDFTQKEGCGNFKKKDDSEEEDTPLESVQFVVGPKSSRFKMTCEIRVHSFNNRPFHTLWLGKIDASGSPGGDHTRHDVSQDEIGKWIKLEFRGSFSSPLSLDKYGFTTDGINEMDVRNVSMIEI